MMRTGSIGLVLAALTASVLTAPVLTAPAFAQSPPHNVILFVADGLRPGMVNDRTAPTLAALMRDGVRFTNTHSMFPTFTTANASALATGHMVGDTGDFSNTIDVGFAVPSAADSRTPFLENDPVLGDVQTAGTLEANIVQQDYFVNVTTKVVLPLFKARGKPFMLVFWSRDPDGTQHNQGDSLNRLVPGINGPTSLASIRNADNDLAALLAQLKALGLQDTTDVIVTADHGFSTITKESATSFAATQSYKDVLPNNLPSSFLAIDIAHGLGMPMLDPDAKYVEVPAGSHTSRGNALIGGDKAHPDVVVAANGGSDLVYLPSGDKTLARKVVDILAAQDYVSGLFVSDDLGPIPGTLPISAIDLKGSAVTPLPAIVVNFRTFSTGCSQPLDCAVEVADTGLQQGQGMHGSFSRADTLIIGGASGPGFRKSFVDDAPTSNADIGKTMAAILGLRVKDTGSLVGRVLTEAMPNGKMPEWKASHRVSEADAAGRRTIVQTQMIGDISYFDAAGYDGRTLGLTVPASVQRVGE
jgi:arylsulfatase A-like enzyme